MAARDSGLPACRRFSINRVMMRSSESVMLRALLAGVDFCVETAEEGLDVTMAALPLGGCGNGCDCGCRGGDTGCG